jgi:hypothetical protein
MIESFFRFIRQPPSFYETCVNPIRCKTRKIYKLLSYLLTRNLLAKPNREIDMRTGGHRALDFSQELDDKPPKSYGGDSVESMQKPYGAKNGMTAIRSMTDRSPRTPAV